MASLVSAIGTVGGGGGWIDTTPQPFDLNGSNCKWRLKNITAEHR